VAVTHVLPQKKFRLPTTIATSTPRRQAIATSLAIRLITFGSMLLGPVQARAAPLIFRTTLRHLGFDVAFDLTLLI
jgi:hypothetical protein